ncbi:MAG TPA: acyl carrier protein [Bryobacteraceae bacterium]|nr:acyl carrier protein [Bryobacteraceae bacterium]HTF64448.1 acyl carrier protein [Edaphobacter sp.]
MNEEQIYPALTVVFRDVLDDDTLILKPTLTARDVEGWDSLTHVNLIVAVESRFGIKFRTAELESLKNVGQFVQLIGQRLAAK